MAPNGSLTLSVIYPAGSKTSIYIAETLALSSRPKCAVYQGDSQCRSTFTTNMGDTVYKDKYGTYTLVRHETQVELGYQARSANEQGASEAQMKVLINSLTLE